ncbi:MAG: hypothetical protein ACRDQ5_21595, partial [Sciscionella sp.]
MPNAASKWWVRHPGKSGAIRVVIASPTVAACPLVVMLIDQVQMAGDLADDMSVWPWSVPAIRGISSGNGLTSGASCNGIRRQSPRSPIRGTFASLIGTGRRHYLRLMPLKGLALTSDNAGPVHSTVE